MRPADKVGITRGGEGAGPGIIMGAPIKVLRDPGQRKLKYPVRRLLEDWSCSGCSATATACRPSM